MFNWRKQPDPELQEFTDEELALIPLSELQRIRNKRWANGKDELVQRADAELARRDPRSNWECLRCGGKRYHEKEMRVSGGFWEGFLNWEKHKYHVLVCNYCGKSEIYNTLTPASEQIMDLMGK